MKGDGMDKHQYTDEEVADWRRTHRNFIYFNREDTNFTVPKAYGYGKTFNYANPVSWVFLAIIMAILVYAVFFRQW